MTQISKDRLVGAVVVIALAIIFLPMIFDGAGVENETPSSIEYAIPTSPTMPKKPDIEIQPTAMQQAKIETIIPKPIVPEKSAPESGTVIQPFKPEKPISFEQAVDKTDTLKTRAEREKEHRKAWVVQVASFTERNQATTLQNKIRKQLGEAGYVQEVQTSQTYYRVLIGPYGLKSEAESVLKQVNKEFKLKGFIKPR